jgi:site-specific DNA-methyltransferase (adenine-specific)
VVDIPYGLGDKLVQGGTWASKYKKGDADWDVLPTPEYFEQLFRISKNQIIWGGNYVQLPPTRGFLIWDKVALMDTMADSEFAWTSFDKNAKTFRHVRNTSEKRIHITQKPTALYSWILKNYAKPNFKLLDTHFGSGSITLAVHKANQLDKMNLHLTACEIDKEYIDKAIKRISESIKQGTLSF